MSTALSPAAERELARHLRQVCARLGVDPNNATLVKYTMNAVFVARPYVLRLAHGPHAVALAHRVVAVAAALEHAGIPTVRLGDAVGTQPIRSGDWVATVWQHVATVKDEAKPIDLAAPLSALHGLDRLDVPLQSWSPVDTFRRRLHAAATLRPAASTELQHWSHTELGMDAEDLLRILGKRCDDVEEQLADISWHLPAGVIHGDAHTGNVLLRDTPRRPRADPTALLCDLDGVCHGPREWDLVPTAHGATRFGRSAADYHAFTEAYGFDITTWSGWPVLRQVRDLQLVTSTINTLAGRPDVARELAHRLRSLLNDDTTVVWTRHR